MKKNELFYKSNSGLANIHMCIWEPDTDIYGVLCVIHSSSSHIGRYEDMGTFLSKGGIVLVGIDLLGHGMSTNDGSIKMYFGTEGSYVDVVKDIDYLVNYIKNLYKDVPFTLLGTGMGSLLAECYNCMFPYKVDGTILIGNRLINGFKFKLVNKKVRKEIAKYGETISTKYSRKVCNDIYNKGNNGMYDWLSTSKSNISTFSSDPLKGGDITLGMLREILNMINFINNNMDKVNKLSKVLILSGSLDNVCNSKEIDKIKERYTKNGINDISNKVYMGIKHDILHEDNKFDIYNDIYGWLYSSILRSRPIVKDEILVDGVKAYQDKKINFVKK